MLYEKLKGYRHYFLGILVGMAVVFASSTFVIEKKTNEFKVNLEQKITELSEKLVLDTASFNQTAWLEPVSMMLCSSEEQTRFDTLLSSLDKSLNSSELNELTRLVRPCAYPVSIARTNRLRVVEARYRELQNLFSLAEPFDLSVQRPNMAAWTEWLRIEKAYIEAYQNLIISQQAIVESLLSGSTKDSLVVSAHAKNARDTRDMLSELNNASVSTQRALFSS